MRGAEGLCTDRLGSRCRQGRAWAPRCQDVDSKSLLGTESRCLSLRSVGSVHDDMGQAMQLLVGRSDPGQWTQRAILEAQGRSGWEFSYSGVSQFLLQ